MDEKFKDLLNVEALSKALSLMAFGAISDLRKKILENYENIESEDLDKIIVGSFESYTKNNEFLVKKVIFKKESKEAVKEEVSDPCIFKLTRGARAGETCGKKCTRGKIFCSVHAKAAVNRGERERENFQENEALPGLFRLENSSIVLIRLDSTLPVSSVNMTVIGSAPKDYMTRKDWEPITITKKDAEECVRKGYNVDQISEDVSSVLNKPEEKEDLDEET